MVPFDMVMGPTSLAVEGCRRYGYQQAVKMLGCTMEARIAPIGARSVIESSCVVVWVVVWDMIALLVALASRSEYVHQNQRGRELVYSKLLQIAKHQTNTLDSSQASSQVFATKVFLSIFMLLSGLKLRNMEAKSAEYLDASRDQSTRGR
jgi:hypothetical protein